MHHNFIFGEERDCIMTQDEILSTIILFIQSVQLMAKVTIPHALIQLINEFIGHWIRIKLCIDDLFLNQRLESIFNHINCCNFYCLYQISSESQPLTIGITVNYDIFVAYGHDSFANWTHEPSFANWTHVPLPLIEKVRWITYKANANTIIPQYGRDPRLKFPFPMSVFHLHSLVPSDWNEIPPLEDEENNIFSMKLIYINHNNNKNSTINKPDQIESKELILSYTQPNPIFYAFNLLNVFTDQGNLTNIAQQLSINGEVELNGEFIIELIQ